MATFVIVTKNELIKFMKLNEGKLLTDTNKSFDTVLKNEQENRYLINLIILCTQYNTFLYIEIG